MESYNLEEYFAKVRQLPLALSAAEVQSIIQTKGVSSPPNKSWWNLNNLIIMCTSTLILSLATAYLFNTNETALYQSPDPYQYSPQDVSMIYLEPDSTKPKNPPAPAIPEKIQEVAIPEAPAVVEDVPEYIVKDPAPVVEPMMLLEEMADMTLEIPSPMPPAPLFDSIPEAESILDEIEEPDTPGDLFEPEGHVGYKDFRALQKGDPKTIKKEISADGINKFVLSNSHGAIKVESWDKPIIALTATVSMEGETEEDVKKGMEDFDIFLKSNGNEAKVSHNWSELSSCNTVTYNWKGKKKSTIKTTDGEKLNIQKVEISYLIQLPSNINLELKNNYADIEVGNLDANLKASLFKGDLRAGNIAGDLDLTEKYGDAMVGNFKEGDLIFFKSKSIVGSSKHTHLKSNYSDLQMGGCEDLDLIGFKTDLIVNGEIKELEGSFKYGDLEVKGNTEQLELNAFKAELTFNDINNSHLSTSYSSLTANKVAKMELENIFQSDFNINELGELEGNLKYTPVKVNRLNKAMDVQTFKGSLEVNQIDADFSKFDLQSKYTHVDLAFAENSKFNLEAETAYTDLTFPSGILSMTYQKQENNRSNLKGVYNSELSKNPSSVNLNFFQGSLNLK